MAVPPAAYSISVAEGLIVAIFFGMESKDNIWPRLSVIVIEFATGSTIEAGSSGVSITGSGFVITAGAAA